MKRILNLIAFVIASASFVLWLAKGSDRGWTKTSVPVKTLDSVTGIEGIEYRKTFVPGVDFLVVAFLASGGLAVAALFIRKKH
jgi:hypothetical protein